MGATVSHRATPSARSPNTTPPSAPRSLRVANRLDLGDGRTRVIRAIGQLYVASDLSRQMVGVNWDVTADVKLTEDLTRSKVLTEARMRSSKPRAPKSVQLAARFSQPTCPNRIVSRAGARRTRRPLRPIRRRGGAAAGRPRRLQADQRHARPFRRRRDAHSHCGDHPPSSAPGDFVARTGGDEFVVVCNADGGMVGLDGPGAANHRRRQQADRPLRP